MTKIKEAPFRCKKCKTLIYHDYQIGAMEGMKFICKRCKWKEKAQKRKLEDLNKKRIT